VKFTKYFEAMRERPDRQAIDVEWINRVVDQPEREAIQHDGRIRRWSAIPEAGGKYLRVVLLPDGETVHNAGLTGALSLRARRMMALAAISLGTLPG